MTRPIRQGGRGGRGTSRRRVLHGDVSQIAGASKITVVLWVVMLAAVGVDLVTFYQVLVLVLDVEEWMVRLAVVGFALVALTLSYYAGLQARQATNPRNLTGSVTVGWISAGVWLALGVAAFIARFVISLPSSAGKSTFVADGVTTSTLADSADATSQRLGAILFLVLYVATGVVAGLHGFFRPEPAVKQYRKALVRRSDVARQQARSNAQLAFARQTLNSIEQARRRHSDIVLEARNRGRVIGQQLGQEASAQLSGLRGRRTARTYPLSALYDIPPDATDPYQATQELPPVRTEGTQQ